MSPITTHVLDTSLGVPAAGIPVRLERQDSPGEWLDLGRGETDRDGRLKTLYPPDRAIEVGTYRLTFETATYYERLGVKDYFFPCAQIVFEIRDSGRHCHVPLLLSPYGYSTYRGS